MIQKILIANRGEIAVRIIRACKDLGIKSVAIYSTADKDGLHVQLADEAVCVGDANSKDSYLNINNILSAALLTHADAIHPGFGFMAENADFARLVQECGLIFIGPHAKAIEMMGNKINARRLMSMAKVPIIPGSLDPIKDVEEGLKQAQEIGYPVIIKAAAGGGGRGIRRVNSEDEFTQVFPILKQEAKNYFKDDTLYIEKLFTNAKHIEVQILADQHGTILHLYERDCSFQRRHQKVIEEAPCHVLSPEKREAICLAAVKAANAVNYDSVGTIEFLMDEAQNFYFMEMNTRIQVEHPVTEMITGIDLIKEQIKIASDLPFTLKQSDINLKGHAIECRINAEDAKTFMPSPGKIKLLHQPGGPGIRFDSHIYSSYTVPPNYDSMIGKLISYGSTRDEALGRMRNALDEIIIEGIKTNIELHHRIVNDKEFIAGGTNIHYLEKMLKE